MELGTTAWRRQQPELPNFQKAIAIVLRKTALPAILRDCKTMTAPLTKTIRAAKFLVIGPLILAMLAVINLMTSPGHWWVQWPALGIGIAWVICLVRVAFAAVVMGGLAVLVAHLRNRPRS